MQSFHKLYREKNPNDTAFIYKKRNVTWKYLKDLFIENAIMQRELKKIGIVTE